MSDTPIPFEQREPVLAAFMMRVFAANGRFLRYQDTGKLTIRGVPRKASCPCGSGLKAKRCHEIWTL